MGRRLLVPRPQSRFRLVIQIIGRDGLFELRQPATLCGKLLPLCKW
jgi:hypothetical protein